MRACTLNLFAIYRKEGKRGGALVFAIHYFYTQRMKGIVWKCCWSTCGCFECIQIKKQNLHKSVSNLVFHCCHFEFEYSKQGKNTVNNQVKSGLLYINIAKEKKNYNF